MKKKIDGETVKSAIALKLRDFFKASQKDGTMLYPRIYKEYIPEGFSLPCFFIWTIKVSQKKRLRNRYTRSYRMDVQYHMENCIGKQYEELSSIGHRLMECLKDIQIERPLRGKDADYVIEDGVLHFYITYALQGYFEEQEPVKQGQLSLKEHIKRG